MKAVVLTASHRPGYLSEVLDSWFRARGIDGYKVIVRVEPGSRAVLEVLENWRHRLDLDVRVNERRLGVRMNPFQAIDDAFEADASFVVYGEDDVIVADDILEMYEWAARKNPADALGVIATQRWIPYSAGQENDVTLLPYFAATGWGTWIDRWYDVLRPGWERGDSRGWDWWIVDHLLGRWNFLMPVYARSQHIGLEGGTHMTAREFDEHLCPSFRPHFPKRRWRLA